MANIATGTLTLRGTTGELKGWLESNLLVLDGDKLGVRVELQETEGNYYHTNSDGYYVEGSKGLLVYESRIELPKVASAHQELHIQIEQRWCVMTEDVLQTVSGKAHLLGIELEVEAEEEGLEMQQEIHIKEGKVLVDELNYD